MGVEKYVSEIKLIEQDQTIVYNYLSNFQNFSQHLNDDLLDKLNGKIPQFKVSNFESDQDSCRFNISGIGNAEIRIVEREPVKTIKISSSEGLPIGLTMWIQLLPVSPYRTKMRVTIHAEMNAMIKMMVAPKLKSGIDQIAEVLSKLPYR